MLLVLAGRIHTLDGARPLADALLVRRGRIIAAGSRQELSRESVGAAVLDLGGATVTPGLTDSHVHLVEWALARREVELAHAPSAAAAAEAVARHPFHGPGGWVRGRGWNPHLWADPPTKDLLDRALPDRPVVLHSHDMHSVWVNSRALEAAGIDAATPDPEGGRIVRDESGAPAGLLLENAMQLVVARIPPDPDAAAAAAVLDAQAELHRLGITGVHSVEMGHVRFDSLRVLDAVRAAGDLRLRVLQHLPLRLLDDALALGLRSGFGGDWLRIGGIKMFLDGALGSRTAWMRSPYEGDPANRGIQVLAPDAFRDAVRRAAAGGLASTVHAIGDAAVTMALDVLSAEKAGSAALPHRIEHVQLCPPDQLARPGAAGVVCSMQPAHLLTDWRPADRHWGRERARGAYAFRSLLDRGAILAFGSDAPVEPVDPRLGLYAAAVRQDLEGAPDGGWIPEERLSVAEALRAYTVGPALAAAVTDRRGRLAPGADADLVAWDRDPLEARGRELLELRCIATVVGGDVVWRAGAR